MKLQGGIRSINDLTEEEKDRIYFLMSCYYKNMSRSVFDNDLTEKKWVILLKDEEEIIQGFTALVKIEAEIEKKKTAIIFSGDTIIHKIFWGSNLMHKLWGRLVFGMALEQHQTDYYWILISKGYKTYRFLPVYFKEFYPRYNMPTPVFEKKLIDWFGAYKYPDYYRSDKGLIIFDNPRDYLSEGVADITQSRLKDPHVSFFAEVNSGHVKGDELVCIARLTKENIKPYVIRHYLGK